MDLLELLLKAEKMSLILSGIILILAYILYRFQTRQDLFDLRDMIIDPETNKVSINRFGQLLAMLISSWGFIYLVINNRLTEVYFTVYMSVYAATSVLGNSITAYKIKNNIDTGSTKVDNVNTIIK